MKKFRNQLSLIGSPWIVQGITRTITCGSSLDAPLAQRGSLDRSLARQAYVNGGGQDGNSRDWHRSRLPASPAWCPRTALQDR